MNKRIGVRVDREFFIDSISHPNNNIDSPNNNIDSPNKSLDS